MNATVSDVMTASVIAVRVDTSHVQGVVTVRDRLEYAGDR